MQNHLKTKQMKLLLSMLLILISLTLKTSLAVDNSPYYEIPKEYTITYIDRPLCPIQLTIKGNVRCIVFSTLNKAITYIKNDRRKK